MGIDRRTFSQKRRAEICLRQEGKCADCGDKLQLRQYQIDHRQALEHSGDNADDNLAAVCIPCHKIKTKADNRGRTHGNRIAAGGKQRKGPPMMGTIASGFKKPMYGKGHWRLTRLDTYERNSTEDK